MKSRDFSQANHVLVVERPPDEERPGLGLEVLRVERVEGQAPARPAPRKAAVRAALFDTI